MSIQIVYFEKNRLQKEKEIRDYLKNAKFVKGRDEYFPIPQNQINYSAGLYSQNPGYN